MKRIAAVFVSVLLVVGFAACNRGAEEAGTTTGDRPSTVDKNRTRDQLAHTTVEIKNTRYQRPSIYKVKAGQTVTWVNKDDFEHTVTADGGEFDSGKLAGGAEFKHKFDDAGAFRYHCEIHAKMRSAVTVE